MKIVSFKDMDTVVDILHTSFMTETFPNSINFVVKQDKRRSMRIYHLMKYQCKMALTFGEIFLSDNQKSCVLFLDSERKKHTPKTLLWNLELAYRCIGFKNVFKVIQREKILKQQHPKVPFLHLWLMATKPAFKGKGIGSKLLNEVIDSYGHSKPIYVETTTESNRNFYTKMGFEIFHETHILKYPLYFLLKPRVDTNINV